MEEITKMSYRPSNGNGVSDETSERQRRQLAALVEHSPDAILRYNASKVHLFANRTAERYFGVSHGEIEGRRIDELPSPVDIGGEWSSALDAVFSSGEPVSFEYASRTAHGERFFEVRMLPELGSDGRFDTVLTVARDITKQRHHERRLEESEDRWRRLVDLNPNAIVITVDDRLIYGNSAAARFYRLETADDLIGRSLYDFFSAVDFTDVHRRLDTLQEGREIGPYHYRLIVSDGEERDVLIYSVPIKYAGKQAVQSVIHDVTEQREYERHLIEARLSAEELVRLKTSIIANLSHEIRTPLANVLGFNEVLRDHVDEEGSQMLDVVEEGVERLLMTLTTLMDLAQLEGGEMSLDLKETNVKSLIQRAVAHVEPHASRKGLDLSVTGDIATAMVDPVMTYQIVWHLIENAVKFTDSGSVDIAVDSDDGDVSVVIRDSGIGMSPEFLPRLFDEFEQESKGLGRSFEGNGLGLTIVKRLIDLLSARILVESTPGEGTTFTISFPKAA